MENICETFVYNKSTLIIARCTLSFEKEKKKKKNLLSSSHPRTFTCVMRTRGACFRFRKYLNARDRYRAASYETSCSRIYVCPTRTRRLSVVLFKRSGEKRKRYISYRRSATPVYRLSVLTLEPHASIHRPRLRSEPRRKGHFGPVTDAFAGEEDRRDISRTNLISRVPPWQEMLESGERRPRQTILSHVEERAANLPWRISTRSPLSAFSSQSNTTTI